MLVECYSFYVHRYCICLKAKLNSRLEIFVKSSQVDDSVRLYVTSYSRRNDDDFFKQLDVPFG